MAKIFKFLFKSLLLLTLCLFAYLWVQRKNIATTVIRHQLVKLDVYDLNFTVAEISPFQFELRDIAWGDPKQPFCYISSLKLSYSPQGLLNGRLDKVSIGRFETALALDQQDKPQSELMERGLKVVERVKELYPPGDKATAPFVLPEFKLERGTLKIFGSGDFKFKGQVELTTQMNSAASRRVGVKGEVVLPQGKSTAINGYVEFDALDWPSLVSARVQIGVDMRGLVGAATGLPDETLFVSGGLHAKELDRSPVWELKLQIDPKQLLMETDSFVMRGRLLGESEFSGTASNVRGNGGFHIDHSAFHIKGGAEGLAISNFVEHVYCDFKLPESDFDQMGGAMLVGNVGVSNLTSSAGDLFSLRGGRVQSAYSISAGQGIRFDESVLDWNGCDIDGLAIEPGDLRISVSNAVACIQSSVSIADEPLLLVLDAIVPLSDLQSGSLRVELPPVRVDNTGKLGKLVRRKTGQRLDFSGVLTALVQVEGLHPGAVVTGLVELAEGSVHKDTVDLKGISMTLPFEFNKKIRSTGEPVLTIEKLEAGNIRMGPGKVFFQLKEQELFIERGQIAWAKGFLHAYAIHAGLDGNIRNEFVIYADKVDLGEVFMLVMPFNGRMEGVLYGRFPVVLKKKRVELSGGYLYSLPNQGGMLKLNDPTQMEELLKRAGITDDREKSLSHALSDLDLTSLRIDLEPALNGDSSLRIKLNGKSNYQKRPAPVNLNLNLNGQLQQLLNLGMDLQQKL